MGIDFEKLGAALFMAVVGAFFTFLLTMVAAFLSQTLGILFVPFFFVFACLTFVVYRSM
jgi:hypothetical protein